MVTRYFILLTALLVCITTRPSDEQDLWPLDEQVERLYINGQFFENGELVEQEVVEFSTTEDDSDCDDNLVPPLAPAPRAIPGTLEAPTYSAAHKTVLRTFGGTILKASLQPQPAPENTRKSLRTRSEKKGSYNLVTVPLNYTVPSHTINTVRGSNKIKIGKRKAGAAYSLPVEFNAPTEMTFESDMAVELPTTTTTTPQVDEVESIPAGDLLRTVTSGSITKTNSQSLPILPTVRKKAPSKNSLRTSMPELRKRGRNVIVNNNGITNELKWEIIQFNAAARLHVELGPALNAQAQKWFDLTQYGYKELSKEALKTLEGQILDIKNWNRKNNRLKS